MCPAPGPSWAPPRVGTAKGSLMLVRPEARAAPQGGRTGPSVGEGAAAASASSSGPAGPSCVPGTGNNMNKTGLSLSLGAHAPGRMDGHQRNGVPLWWAQSEAAFALRLRTWPPLEKSLLPGAKAGKGAGGNRSTLAGRPTPGLELHHRGGGAVVTPRDSPGHRQWLWALGQLRGKPQTDREP